MKVDWDAALRLAQKSAYLQAAQEISGIRFDQEKAKALLERIRYLMSEIEDDVEPKLPSRKLKKSEENEYTLPAKPFKQDGSFSHHMLKFLERHGIEADATSRTLQWQGQPETIVGGKLLPATKPMTLSNQDDLKDYLVQEGWEPSLWNLKKENGKPVRDPKTKATIRTTPKMQENGKLCPNMEEMSGTLVKQVVKWLSCRNRHSVLEGWLSNPRLAFDGKLTAASSGITNTFRQKHTVVANIPKNKEHVLFGKEMRELFIANEGQVLVGYDASSLEDRIKGHFTSKYDSGAYAAKILAPGYDPHQENADLWGIDRSIAKNGTYALGYFCGVDKLATTIKCSKQDAATRHQDYWKLNSALKQLDEALGAHWEANGKKYIVGIDGRKVFSRHRHGLVNLLIQSTGSIIMDFSAAWMDKALGGLVVMDGEVCYNVKGHEVFRVGFFHDEYIYSCDPEVAEYVAELGKKSIQKAGEHFKLRVPLMSEAKISTDWSKIH